MLLKITPLLILGYLSSFKPKKVSKKASRRLSYDSLQHSISFANQPVVYPSDLNIFNFLLTTLFLH